jgi:hypothetical protein
MTIETVMSVMTDDDPAAIVGKIEFESVIPANWDQRGAWSRCARGNEIGSRVTRMTMTTLFRVTDQ